MLGLYYFSDKLDWGSYVLSIVGRNRINALTKPGNYYLSSIFFLSALFWEF